MTFQTSAPVDDLRMNISARSCGDLIRQQKENLLTWELPYQRGAVWTTEQRILLIFSLMSGTPIPAIIINSRPDHMWYGPTGEVDQPIYAVIDGKQRLMTIAMWMRDELLLPASWFEPDDVLATTLTEDGPYVSYTQLARRQGRFFENRPLPVAEARLGSVRAEAQIYLRVNGSGTPQADEDIARAAEIASGDGNQ